MACCSESGSPCSGRTFTMFLTVIALLMMSSWFHTSNGALYRPSRYQRSTGPHDGPPVKPEKFLTMDDLNQYLADLSEYYTVVARPRFGKRFGMQDELDEMSNAGRPRYRRDVKDVIGDSVNVMRSIDVSLPSSSFSSAPSSPSVFFPPSSRLGYESTGGASRGQVASETSTRQDVMPFRGRANVINRLLSHDSHGDA